MNSASSTFFANSNVLVTGATGLLGSNLVQRLLQLNANVICFVRDADPASALWWSGDIDRVAVASGRLEAFEHIKSAIVERDVDAIFHLGAQAIVGAGHRDPLATFESNIRGTYNLLEACRLYGDRVRRIIIASSDKAYGECDSLPYTESTPLAAVNPYDVSKCCADVIAQSYAATYQLPIAIARCGNIYGPGDLNWSRLVPGTIRSLLQGERPIIRSNGSLLRDYLFVDDAVDAYLALAGWLDHSNTNMQAQRAFNFSHGRPLTVLDMVSHIQRACGRADLQPIIQDASRGEIAAQHLDSSRARQLLEWRACADLEKSLATTVLWYDRYLRRRNPQAETLALNLNFQSRASA